MERKRYKIWVRVAVEEFDPKTDSHRDVVVNEAGEIEEDIDPQEISIGMFCSPKVAQKAKEVVIEYLESLSN